MFSRRRINFKPYQFLFKVGIQIPFFWHYCPSYASPSTRDHKRGVGWLMGVLYGKGWLRCKRGVVGRELCKYGGGGCLAGEGGGAM